MIVPAPRVARAPSEIKLNKVIVVEGDTPQHFFEALARHMEIENDVEIWNYGGVRDLRRFLKSFVLTPGFDQVKSLGIVRDAEEDPRGAKDSIDSAIRESAMRTEVQVKSLILPTGDTQGMIETLMMRAVADTPVFKCVERFLASAKENGAKLPENFRIVKHEIQAFLAANEHVQMMPGVASYKNPWNWDGTTFATVREFLASL